MTITTRRHSGRSHEREYMKLKHPLSVAALFLATTWAQSTASAHPPARFGAIETGKLSLYHTQNGVPRNDLSGAATDGNNILFVDDGGDAGAGYGFNFVRVTSDLPDTDGVNIPLTKVHNDVEGAAYSNGYFWITTSFSAADPDTRHLTRFKLDARHNKLIGEQSVDITASLNEGLRQTFGDEWYDSWKNLAAKSGGLNVEGLSASHKGGDRIVLGLRSPLFGGDFPTDLHSGNAILATVKNPFGAHPTWDFITADFGGLGVRGVEWIPALHSYVVSAGPVEKATEYRLYQVFPNGDVEQLNLPGMDQMCRPETVMQQTKRGKDYLVVISEDSGPECTGVPFTFIRAEIKKGNGGGHDCDD